MRACSDLFGKSIAKYLPKFRQLNFRQSCEYINPPHVCFNEYDIGGDKLVYNLQNCEGIWPLQWRYNGHDGVLNHQPHDCLLKRLFRRKSKKTSKLRDTGDRWIPRTKG